MNDLPWRCAGDEMSELRLDYQTNSSFSLAGAVLLAFAVAAVVLTGANYLKLSSQVTGSEAKLERNHASQNKGRMSEQGSVELAQEISNANEVLRQLSVPWETLFHAVESSAGGKVTLLALEPDVEKHQVKINGETKNFKSLTNYITQLQGQEVFGSVYLQSHQVQQQDPDKPVRFSLLATWRENQ
jgi:Tfp pilus assembly protein PilN